MPTCEKAEILDRFRLPSSLRTQSLSLQRLSCLVALAFVLGATLLVASPTAMAAALTPAEFFETSVRPLLAEKCFSCHTQTKMGGLEMVSREVLLRGGQSGPAVEPRAPERSLLIKAIRHTDQRLRMPPAGRLSQAEIKTLTKWVEDGAPWPESHRDSTLSNDDRRLVITSDHRNFWAFRPVRRREPPPGQGSAIDRFIDAKLREARISPSAPADKRTLLRRVHYDLVGLPPSPSDVEAFLADDSPDALAYVVDRLLASPRYGERWGRHWLDVARYSDDRLNSTQDEPYPNAWRYRDWVIRAFNEDMPYDVFVKAQIAADQVSESEAMGWTREELLAGLGLFGLSPKFQDDRVDITGRGFLALTVGCAECHDHKFDPIPTEDYYALLGVFNSSDANEHPLASEDVVQAYDQAKRKADDATARLDEFITAQSGQLVEALAARTGDYICAAWEVSGPPKAPLGVTASERGLDAETLERWVEYLSGWPKEHPLLDGWKRLVKSDSTRAQAELFGAEVESKVLYLIAEKKRIEKENEIRLGGDRSGTNIRRTALLALPRDEFYLWNDLVSPNSRNLPSAADTGILYYKGDEIMRFLSGVWTDHLVRSRAAVADLEREVPAKYPFLHVLADKPAPVNEHVRIRGSEDNLGDEVPRRFLSVLSAGVPEPFTGGSGRLDLARAIAAPENPLTARVMANRIWMHHFGRGVVATPSNFGIMGEPPTHPELLDYLATQLVDSGWSVKALHREILLTDAYGRASQINRSGVSADPENRLFWRTNRRRLDAESLLDSILYVSGNLLPEAGGPPQPWDASSRRRRTVYGFVSRRRLDVRLGLFDFPNPNRTSAQRFGTNTPLQGLFFLNSELLIQQAQAFARRLGDEAGTDARPRIRHAYRILYGREPTDEELDLTTRFAQQSDGTWPSLAQTLMSANEFLYVN